MKAVRFQYKGYVVAKLFILFPTTNQPRHWQERYLVSLGKTDMPLGREIPTAWVRSATFLSIQDSAVEIYEKIA